MTYQVKLAVFEGPFDLLLQLIARRRLDVTDIDLAEITAEYLVSIGDVIDEFDLETATRFLIVAATLVELKAARLLPREDRDQIEDLLSDARDMLYARLLEYRAFRDVARSLSHRLDRHGFSLSRDIALEPWILRLVPDTQRPIDAAGLAALAASVAAPVEDSEIDLTHIRRTYLTIRDAATHVLGALERQGSRVPYSELVDGRGRSDRVVIFLAVLELFKLGHVDLEQQHFRAALSVERLAGGTDLASITDEELEAEFDLEADPQDQPPTTQPTLGMTAG
ncbi:MAG: ScpA family protein [Nitriliruptoraceae bacterium]